MTDWTLHIETNPDILFGKPVIYNTRIPVDLKSLPEEYYLLSLRNLQQATQKKINWMLTHN